MDHFRQPPSELAVAEDPSFKALEEHQYASKIMSFSRPLRDKFKDVTEETLDPLVNFEIRDFGPVRSVVLPGWKRSASPEEVRRKMARRIGDSIEFSEDCLFFCRKTAMRILPKTSRDLNQPLVFCLTKELPVPSACRFFDGFA